MGIQYRDDTSLQAWGRGLKTIEPALQEVADKHKGAHEATKAAADAVTKLAQQAQSDLPAAKPLAAEADSLAAGLRSLAADEEALARRRADLIGRAAALPGMYAREHETDEDRLNAPRNSTAAEQRADVRHAQQDT
jgi:hypothetical protein